MNSITYNQKSEINFYLDTLIVEAILGEPNIIKNAEPGMIMGLIDKVKQYVGNHIDPNDKSGSLINMLAPGVITQIFGGGWLGYLLGGVASFFHIDIASILGSIYREIKSLISGDKKVSSSQIDEVVSNAVKEHSSTEVTASVNFTKNMREAQILKLDLTQYKFNKAASFLSSKKNTVSILSKVLGWIFKVAISSAGLMVVGDAVNKLLGRPNAIDNTMQHGKPAEQTTPEYHSTSTQTKFIVNQNYQPENYNFNDSPWMERVSNTDSGIENMLIQFAKSVYNGLDGLEQNIKSTIGFQKVKDNIVWYNHATPGASIIFIPKYFKSKKQIVDLFIDDVASEEGTQNIPSPNNTNKPEASKGILL